MKQPKIFILIVDLGSQVTSLIGRLLRELGYRSIIQSPPAAEKWLKDNKPKAIILSGGNHSVYEEDSPSPPESIWGRAPIFGICYGMQLIAKRFGGEVTPHQESKEYGPTSLRFDQNERIFRDFPAESEVWTSHGDTVTKLPPGFSVVASSVESGAMAAMSNPQRGLWGVQFHPEVKHTKLGKYILENFVREICHCERDWDTGDEISKIQNTISNVVIGPVGPEKVAVAYSGGVDSSLTAALAVSVIGERAQGICIDTGGLREYDLPEAKINAQAAGIQLRIIDASDLFFAAMAGVTDAEVKRKQRFQPLYGQLLDQAAIDIGASIIMQGGIAPDHIETGKVGQSAHIKTHHNVGLQLKARMFDPIREYFKYEVRDMAEKFGLPKSVYGRQPFPGPGLFIRINGKAATPPLVQVVRWADVKTKTISERHGIYDKMSQLVVALNCVPTVGIKGDDRCYENSIVVRAVDTLDFMTAEGYQFPAHVRREITQTITKHPNVVRVFYDETPKPPATTEME